MIPSAVHNIAYTAPPAPFKASPKLVLLASTKPHPWLLNELEPHDLLVTEDVWELILKPGGAVDAVSIEQPGAECTVIWFREA